MRMKRLLKKTCAVALSMTLCVTAFSAIPEVKAAPKTKKITLSAKKKKLPVGSKFKLKVKKVKPAKASKKVTWKSSNKSVATVNKRGVVKAKKVGTAKITAISKKNKKAKATCKVTVIKKSNDKSTNNTPSPTPTATPTPPNSTPPANDTPTTRPTKAPITPTPVPPIENLKDLADFNMGTVVNYEKTQNQEFTELAKKHFDIVSFENEMKGYSLLDVEASQQGDGTPVCNFEQADEMVEWAIANGLRIRGHVLIWEASMKDEFFYKGWDTTAELVDKETLLDRMKSYETQVIKHFETKYPGTVIAWDVINEAVDANPDAPVDEATGLHLYNTGKFYQILGGEYIKYAFQFAKEAVKETGKDIPLFYNDFNCFQSPKTGYIEALIDYLNADTNNKLLDCMGMEGYVLTDWPEATDVGTAMARFAKKGVKVGINELTVRLSPGTQNKDQVTATDIARHAKKYKNLFSQYCKFVQKYPNTLTNVSIWGLLDRPELLEDKENYDYQVYGTHSGLFTENLEPKTAFYNVMEVLKKYQTPA